MEKRTVAYGAAATGVTAGVVGLVLLTVPAGAGAGPAPALPKTTPEALLSSVMQAKPQALHGTVEVQNDLGLPAVPSVPQLANGDSEAQIWTDGKRGFRASLPYEGGERTFVANGNTFWRYNSAERTAIKTELDAEQLADNEGWSKEKAQLRGSDPATASREIISAIRKFSDVAVDGTASVADRDAYQLVLTPKPTERTLLREVRVAVDNASRMPLRLDVYTNGTPDPALRIGYSELEVGPQDAATFQFTPPAGTKVNESDGMRTEQRMREHADGRAKAADFMASAAPRVVGSGWDTVLVANVPKELLQGDQDGQAQGEGFGPGGPGAMNPGALLRQFGTEVNGAFGKGWVLSTKVGSALITEDGRIAAGFVPRQVLTSTLAGAR